MKFSVGDDIIIRATKEKGKVVHIIDHQMVEISIEKTTIPIYISEIDFPYFDLFTTMHKSTASPSSFSTLPKEKPQTNKAYAMGFNCILIPIVIQDYFGDDAIEKFKLHFTNSSGNDLNYEYEFIVKNNVLFQHTGDLRNNSELYIHDVLFEDMSQSPILKFYFYNKNALKHEKSIWDIEFKIKPKKLYELIDAYRKKNAAVIPITIFENIPLQINQENDFFLLSAPNPNIINTQNLHRLYFYMPHTIDLHIEKLVKNPEGLLPIEKLQLQLNTLEKSLDNAIMHNMQKITVIHGIGKGVLLEHIKEILDRNSHVRSHKNEFDARYGYGATHIYLK